MSNLSEAMKRTDEQRDTKVDDAELWAAGMNFMQLRRQQIGRNLWSADDLAILTFLINGVKKMNGIDNKKAEVHVKPQEVDSAIAKSLETLNAA